MQNYNEEQATEMMGEMSMEVNRDFGYTLNDKDLITRLLILGSRINVYHQNKNNKLSKEDIAYVQSLIGRGDGKMIIDLVKEIYASGRAPKQDVTLQMHALLCRSSDINVRGDALRMINDYRTISHIYSWKNFHSNCENAETGKITKGFGRGVKRNLNDWFLKMKDKPMDLAYQITKYGARNGWSFEQLIKCSHLKTGTGDDRPKSEIKSTSGEQHSIAVSVSSKEKAKAKSKTTKPTVDATAFDLVLRYAVNGTEEMTKLAEKFSLAEEPVYKYLLSVHEAKHMEECNVDKLINLIYINKLTREQVPTWALKNKEVLTALLVNVGKTRITMPLTALLRNLGNMSAYYALDDEIIRDILCKHLLNNDVISKSRIHPVNILTAWFTYRNGQGMRGNNTWHTHSDVLKALEEMFYLSFKNVEPTGKRICFLIDASGSMQCPSLCESVSNSEAAALLAMIFSRSETKNDDCPNHSFYLFTSTTSSQVRTYGSYTGLTDVSDLIHPKAKLSEVLKSVQRSDWGTTDISMGILEAMKYRRKFDAFVVITDCDVNSGIKPSEAMKQYRKELNLPNAKLAVIGTQGSDFTIADPSDPFMMDFCGFDSHGPKLLQEFIKS